MAGELRQEWTWRDIFRSIGMAFSFSRLTIGFLGLLLFAVVDNLLAWTMVQPAVAQQGAWLLNTIWWGRLIICGYILLFTAVAIAYSVKNELIDGEGTGVGKSIGFAFKKFGAVFFMPVLFWVYIAIVGGLGFVFFLLPSMIARLAGWELFVSPIWFALSFPFMMIFAILAALGFLAFLFSLFLAPPIIAVRQEGALDASLDSVDLMRGKGAFWVAILVLAVAFFVVGPFLAATFHRTYRCAEYAMGGETYQKIVSALPAEIQLRPYGLLMDQVAFRSYWPRPSFRPVQPEIQHRIAGWILGIWLLVTIGYALSFVLNSIVSASTLTYLIVREEDEFLEPATVEVPPPGVAKVEAQKASEEKPAETKAEEKDENKG